MGVQEFGAKQYFVVVVVIVLLAFAVQGVALTIKEALVLQ